jgi:phosphate transport system protein
MAFSRRRAVQEFSTERDALIDLLVRSGDTVVEMLGQALGSLVDREERAAAAVIAADDRVDATYAELQHRAVAAMSVPGVEVADHRQLAALLHVNIHLERMGDYAVNVARAGLRAADEPGDPELAGQLREMGLLATDVARTAVRAFARRDVEMAGRLPALDDGVDRLNVGVFRRLVKLAAADEARLWWATHMILVARQVERYADHAVDIGEATVFAATGEVVELSSNASRDSEQT